MEYDKNLIRDFAERTKVNLALVRASAKEGRKGYEVTQLMNSMLGLLVFPREEFYNNIPQLNITEMQESGWPIPRVLNNYRQVVDLNQLVRYLRNGIAHFNLLFTAASDGHIDGLIIWNEWNGQKNWEAELKIDELEEITRRFIQLILDEEKMPVKG